MRFTDELIGNFARENPESEDTEKAPEMVSFTGPDNPEE